MSWKNIKLILGREVRDQLRDRRTLFMIAILPLLLYPALGIGMVQMTVLFSEQPRTVVVLGAEHLPKSPQLLGDDRIIAEWFDIPSDAEKLIVVTDRDAPADAQSAAIEPTKDSAPPDEATRRAKLIAHSEKIRLLLADLDKLKNEEDQAREQGNDEQVATSIHLQALLRKDIGKQFDAGQMQVLIVVPSGFGENIERTNQQIAERHPEGDVVDYARPVIVRNSADEKSLIAYRRVKEALENWEEEILKRRLVDLDLPASLPTPVNPAPLDLAEQDQIAANLWSKLFPALLVIMALTGAFYPAIDVAAGEKERGTMETLLICPAMRSEIVVGKFLTVMLFSVSTAVLNIASMGFTGRYMVSLVGSGALSGIGDVSFPSPMALLWVFVLLIPLAALFSALCLALATFARSNKEGQYYFTPLLLVTMGMTVFCLSPAVEIQPFFSILPVAGPSLLLKELLASPGSTEPLVYALPVLITSVGYGFLALWWAIELFSREDVLFREAERFELALWIRHVLRDKEPTPSFIEAGFCFLVVIFLQFGAIRFMQSHLAQPAGDPGQGMMRVQMVQQLVTIACPALFMGILLTASVKKTFRLRLPGLGVLAAAAALPWVLHPLSLELANRLRWFFPPLPAGIEKVAAAMSSAEHPLWLPLLAFAVVPAVCEEVAFRGFILSGFSRSRRVWLAIMLSSLTFGITHMIPQQVFNATLVGLVLGLIAVRGNSLYPCIVFHFSYNAIEVLRSRFSANYADRLSEKPNNWFFSFESGSLHYEWLTLLICAGVTTTLLLWLVRRPNDGAPSASMDADASNLGDRAGSKATGQPPVRI